MNAPRTLLAITSLAWSACIHDPNVLIAKPARAPNCDVRVFSKEEYVSDPYERVCIIRRTVPNEGDELTVERARKVACKCGAQAVLLTPGASTIGYGIDLLPSTSLTVRH